ncbi:TetR/AcrR family transcriptional regulator [Pararoseomonas indoligenes]|uniref:TetR/AcrR family transcriptional regulator n=1 Tax=Roseomonas indoligenes TaxID=2820811 RepID=A0A940MY47_9PROT|nr:TetR/AcrR family transcriptional regulator [Pararoseomonas indoligenes]MBP0494241.1 TetR/AcrR family transcriptional regulator [Pararoseomonas indoligenes]
MAAAEAAFVAQGFRLTTMDTVARGAGCSKKTLYKLFNSKEELFQELLATSRRAFERLPVATTLPPEEALEAFLADLAAMILRDSHIALTRIAVAEAGQLPRPLPAPAGEPEIARLALDDYLAELGRTGAYDMPDPAEAARMLIGMALGAFHHELLAGLEARVPEDTLARRIRTSVRIFLLGCRAPVAMA